jgi:hypothetical protein
MVDENTPKPSEDSSEKAAKPVAKAAKAPAEKASAAKATAAEATPKAKKEKAPALEDKPFVDFIREDYIPALKEALTKQGQPGAELSFERQPINVIGFKQAPDCWQIIGRWSSSWKQPREFRVYFFADDIQAQKGFSYSESGGKASTLESFLIDERKVNLGLLVFGALQRLNAQKWLVRN